MIYWHQCTYNGQQGQWNQGGEGGQGTCSPYFAGIRSKTCFIKRSSILAWSPSSPPDFQTFHRPWIMFKSSSGDLTTQHSNQSYHYEKLFFYCKFRSFDAIPGLFHSGGCGFWRYIDFSNAKSTQYKNLVPNAY